MRRIWPLIVGALSVGCSQGGAGPAGVDTRPPGDVFASRPFVDPDGVTLTWTEPADVDFAGVLIVRQQDDYPENSGDGTLISDVPKGTQAYIDTTAPVTESSIAVYYTIFAYDADNNVASGARVGVHCSNRGCIGVPELDKLNRIVDNASAHAVRASVLEYLWGRAQLPERMPRLVEPITDAEYDDVASILSIERITVEMDAGLNSVAYLFQPVVPRNRLAIYHQGHAGAFSHGKDTISRLLSEGYTVLAFSMPLLGMNETLDGSRDHNDFADVDRAVRFFLEPIAVALNYVSATYFFKDISMIGLSGGGWTTVVYSALDPRIASSYPVAGSYPLFIRDQIESSAGDYEQFSPEFYDRISYIELYILGMFNRRQLQVFNLNDSCCFQGTYARTYERYVQQAADSLGGSFDVLIDDTHAGHRISAHALERILTDLEP